MLGFNPHDIYFENQSMQKRTKVYLRAGANTFITAAQLINKLSEHLLFWSLSWCTIVRKLNNIHITPNTSWTLSMIRLSEVIAIKTMTKRSSKYKTSLALFGSMTNPII